MKDVPWSTGYKQGEIRPNLSTEFERVVRQLKLESEDEILRSRLLFNWVSHNRRKRYVPEHILIALNMTLSDQELYMN